MTSARLLRRRAGAQLGLLALVALLAGLVATTLVTVLGQVALSAQAGLARALLDAGPTGAAMQVATPRAKDPDLQVEAAEQVLDAELAGFPVAVQRSARSTELTVEGHPTVVAAGPGLAGLVQVVDGELPADGDPPSAPVPASVSQQTAAALGVTPGDVVDLVGAGADAEPLTVEIAAVWEPIDPADPVWFGQTDGVWVPESALDEVPATVRLRWTVVPDPIALEPDRIPALRTALTDTVLALKADDAVDELGVLATEGLDGTLARIDRTLSTVRALSLPATLLAVAVGIVVLAQLAALLADVRLGELVLLRSRGASRSGLVGGALVEGVVVGAVGAALGTGAAVLGLRTTGTPSPVLTIGASVGVTLGVGSVLAAALGWRVRGPLREQRADRPLRGSALLAAAVLAVLAAAIGLWRLVSTGSPVRVVDGRATADPLAAAALTLGLLAVGVLVATLVPPAARAVSVVAARRRDLRVLAVQQVARRPGAHSATAALVALAVATAVVVAFFLGSWQTLRAVRTAVTNGADLRLAEPDLIGAARAADPTSTVVPAGTAEATFGGVDAQLVAVPQDVWPLLHRSPVDPVPRSDAAPVAAVPLAPGATSLEVTLAVVSAAPEDPELAVTEVTGWLRTDGAVHRVELRAAEADAGTDAGTSGWSAELSPGSELLALDVRVTASQPYRVEVRALPVAASAGAGWHAVALGRTATVLTVADGPTAHVPAEAAVPATTVRFATSAPGPLPAVLTRTLADALALEVGDRTTLTVPGHTVTVQVAQLVTAVPGSDRARALLVDLDSWTAAQLWTGTDVDAPDEVWAWGGSDALRDALPGATSAVPGPTPLLDPALTAFRIATWATVALAVGGVLAAARAGARSRRPEIGALRGIGTTASAQARMRVAEHARVVTPAVLGGALGGLGLAALVTVPLVSALDAGTVPLPVSLQADLPVLVGWLTAVLVAVTLVVASVAWDTARRARHASPREAAP